MTAHLANLHFWVLGFRSQPEQTGGEEHKSHDADEYRPFLTGDDERHKPEQTEQDSHHDQEYGAAPDLEVGCGQDLLVTINDLIDEVHPVLATIPAREAVGHLRDAGATQSAPA